MRARLPILVMLLWLPVLAQAEATPVQRLHAFLAKAASLQAEFSQSQVHESGAPGQKTSGLFYLQRPGKFRWDYLKPYRQEIVSNGGKVWFYDVDLEQVTTKKMTEAIGSTPALLLSGEVALDKNFKIEDQGPMKASIGSGYCPRIRIVVSNNCSSAWTAKISRAWN